MSAREIPARDVTAAGGFSIVRVGDVVLYRPCFGMQAPIAATVRGLTITDRARSKYGREVRSVPWAVVSQNRVVFSFDQHWAYSEQVIGPVGSSS